ncbi:hypothetical protein CABS03_05829 [Colletotrichum abscissum]
MESSIAPAIVFLDSSWAFLNRHIRRQWPRDVTADFQEISGTSSLGTSDDICTAMSPQVSPVSTGRSTRSSRKDIRPAMSLQP